MAKFRNVFILKLKEKKCQTYCNLNNAEYLYATCVLQFIFWKREKCAQSYDFIICIYNKEPKTPTLAFKS